MNPFEMVVIIVAIVVFGKAIQSAIEKRHRREGEKPPVGDDRIERLEERVRVLEQIVTDSGYDLRRQFRDLERDA